MKFLRPLLGLAVACNPDRGVWLWWSLPSRVDMADYAPANSIVYVEFNNLAGVAQAIQNSDVWQAAAPITQSKPLDSEPVYCTAARARTWTTSGCAIRACAGCARRSRPEYF